MKETGNNEQLRAVAERLVHARTLKRWRQRDAAERIGVALRTYQVWESATGGISWENLARVSAVMGIPEGELQVVQPAVTSELSEITAMLRDITARLERLEAAVVPSEALERELVDAAARRPRPRGGSTGGAPQHPPHANLAS